MQKKTTAALVAAALAVLVVFGLLVFRMVTTMSSRAPEDVVVFGLLVFRMVTTMSSRAPEDVDTAPGLAYLQAQEKADVAENENALRSQQATTAAVQQTTSAIQDGNFRAAFRDTLICGDSLMKALTEYSILDKSQVIATSRRTWAPSSPATPSTSSFITARTISTTWTARRTSSGTTSSVSRR